MRADAAARKAEIQRLDALPPKDRFKEMGIQGLNEILARYRADGYLTGDITGRTTHGAVPFNIEGMELATVLADLQAAMTELEAEGAAKRSAASGAGGTPHR
jgi:hypothetical protein